MIQHLLELEALRQLGWVAVHFLWQGAVFALFAWAGGNLCRTARIRHRIALGALVAMLLCPVFTFAVLRSEELAFVRERASGQAVLPIVEPVGLQVAAARDAVALSPGDFRLAAPAGGTASQRSVRWPAVVALLWMAGVMALSWRLPLGWGQLAGIRRTAEVISESRVAAALGRAAQALGCSRAVTLLTHAAGRTPMTFGWLKPVILLPPAAVAGLTTEQLEAILAHELAHIVRHDFLISVLQSLAETLLFFHPGVWWVSRRIAEERELACDDMVIAALGDRLTYAKALSCLAEQRARLALAANAGPLLARIRRILGGEPTVLRHGGRVWMAVGVSVAVLGAVGLFLVRAQEAKADADALRV